MLRYGRRVCGHSSCLFSLASSLLHKESEQQSAHTSKHEQRVKDADRHRCITAHWRRRACPHPAAQKTQVSSSTSAACPTTTVSSAGRRGQLRIRKRMTPASSSRNVVDGRARPAPVATPDRRRGLSQTNASRARPTSRGADRHSPTRAGRGPGLGAARGGGPRHRDGAAAARARPCLNRPLLAAAARASRVAMPAQALKDGEEAAEEIFQQDESVRSLDSRKNRRV